MLRWTVFSASSLMASCLALCKASIIVEKLPAKQQVPGRNRQMVMMMTWTLLLRAPCPHRYPAVLINQSIYACSMVVRHSLKMIRLGTLVLCTAYHAWLPQHGCFGDMQQPIYMLSGLISQSRLLPKPLCISISGGRTQRACPTSASEHLLTL